MPYKFETFPGKIGLKTFLILTDLPIYTRCFCRMFSAPIFLNFSKLKILCNNSIHHHTYNITGCFLYVFSRFSRLLIVGKIVKNHTYHNTNFIEDDYTAGSLIADPRIIQINANRYMGKFVSGNILSNIQVERQFILVWVPMILVLYLIDVQRIKKHFVW